MGKGDKKSRRGKIVLGSYGVRRPRKKDKHESKPIVEVKVKEPKKKEQKELAEKEVKDTKAKEKSETKSPKPKKEAGEPKPKKEKKS